MDKERKRGRAKSKIRCFNQIRRQGKHGEEDPKWIQPSAKESEELNNKRIKVS